MTIDIQVLDANQACRIAQVRSLFETYARERNYAITMRLSATLQVNLTIYRVHMHHPEVVLCFSLLVRLAQTSQHSRPLLAAVWPFVSSIRQRAK